MKIPNKIRIGYKDYEVLCINSHVVMDNRVCYGAIYYNDDRIEISTLHSLDTQKCALVHEILHGIDEMYKLGLKESQVEQLAKGLYQVIKDNPDMFKEEQT